MDQYMCTKNKPLIFWGFFFSHDLENHALVHSCFTGLSINDSNQLIDQQLDCDKDQLKKKKKKVTTIR